MSDTAQRHATISAPAIVAVLALLGCLVLAVVLVLTVNAANRHRVASEVLRSERAAFQAEIEMLRNANKAAQADPDAVGRIVRKERELRMEAERRAAVAEEKLKALDSK